MPSRFFQPGGPKYWGVSPLSTVVQAPALPSQMLETPLEVDNTSACAIPISIADALDQQGRKILVLSELLSDSCGQGLCGRQVSLFVALEDYFRVSSAALLRLPPFHCTSFCQLCPVQVSGSLANSPLSQESSEVSRRAGFKLSAGLHRAALTSPTSFVEAVSSPKPFEREVFAPANSTSNMGRMVTSRTWLFAIIWCQTSLLAASMPSCCRLHTLFIHMQWTDTT